MNRDDCNAAWINSIGIKDGLLNINQIFITTYRRTVEANKEYCLYYLTMDYHKEITSIPNHIC